MRTNGSLIATIVCLLAVIGGAIGAVAVMGGTTAAAQSTGTERVVVRPVTVDGVPANGYRSVVDHRPAIQCTNASAGAVDDGIAFCGSSADNTVACWASAEPGRVLCLTDPLSYRLRSIRLAGAFPAVSAPRHRTPQALLLHDGSSYLVRDGGAWGTVDEHPSWVGAYFERHGGGHTVYGPARTLGIDRTDGHWVVTTYLHGTGHGTRRHVDRAYYVGTAR